MSACRLFYSKSKELVIIVKDTAECVGILASKEVHSRNRLGRASTTWKR